MGTAIVEAPRSSQRPTENGRFWIAAGGVLAAGAAVVLWAINLLLGVPDPIGPWLFAALLPIVVSVAAAAIRPCDRLGPAALREAIVVVGLSLLIVAVYLVVVVGLGQPVTEDQRGLLALSVVAAAVVAMLVLPLRARVDAFAARLTAKARAKPGDILSTLQARMTRAVPMDELLLSLAEQLRAALDCEVVQVYTGGPGRLDLVVSLPNASATAIELGEHERSVVGRTRIGGPKWAEVWLPALASSPLSTRVSPLSHQGEVLGLIVVRRSAADFVGEEERVLVELARQFGLALHNVQLDSALQRSLIELEQRNHELRDSRLRIVTASNETRRLIERNLHDGAQQNLVALAVKIGLVAQIFELGDSARALRMLDELRGDVQVTVQEVRELAHGIYPPLLRDKGLRDALRAAATRSALAVTVDADELERHHPDIEAAVYFCCVEALQNAGKYAGDDAEVTVIVDDRGDELRFEVADNGFGFDAGDDSARMGNGFTNMLDRVGALGGSLRVNSSPGTGTTIIGVIPVVTPVSETSR